MRSYDSGLLKEPLDLFLGDNAKEVDPVEWISNKANVLLINNKGDVAIFEHETPGVVTGHYYFTSRGRAAINVGKQFIQEVFDEGVQLIRGLTPLTNLGARWMSRRLGFTSHGVVQTLSGPHELFIMHKSDYKL